MPRPRPPHGADVTNPHRPLAGALAVLVALATLAVASPASAAGYTGGLAPAVLGGRLDMNGSGGVGGRDDSNAFYGQTDVIDGAIDCDSWGAVPNAGDVTGDVEEDMPVDTMSAITGAMSWICQLMDGIVAGERIFSAEFGDLAMNLMEGAPSRF